MSRLLTGAQTVAHINNKPYAMASFDWSVSYQRREAHCVDWLGPVELIPGSQTVHGTMIIYRLRGDGGIESAGIAGTQMDSSVEKYFSILVTDRIGGATLFQADRCSVDSQSWKIGRGYVMGTVSFTCINWNNETPDSTNRLGQDRNTPNP